MRPWFWSPGWMLSLSFQADWHSASDTKGIPINFITKLAYRYYWRMWYAPPSPLDYEGLLALRSLNRHKSSFNSQQVHYSPKQGQKTRSYSDMWLSVIQQNQILVSRKLYVVDENLIHVCWWSLAATQVTSTFYINESIRFCASLSGAPTEQDIRFVIVLGSWQPAQSFPSIIFSAMWVSKMPKREVIFISE